MMPAHLCVFKPACQIKDTRLDGSVEMRSNGFVSPLYGQRGKVTAWATKNHPKYDKGRISAEYYNLCPLRMPVYGFRSAVSGSWVYIWDPVAFKMELIPFILRT
jgi:hypothetical protein